MPHPLLNALQRTKCRGVALCELRRGIYSHVRRTVFRSPKRPCPKRHNTVQRRTSSKGGGNGGSRNSGSDGLRGHDRNSCTHRRRRRWVWVDSGEHWDGRGFDSDHSKTNYSSSRRSGRKLHNGRFPPNAETRRRRRAAVGFPADVGRPAKTSRSAEDIAMYSAAVMLRGDEVDGRLMVVVLSDLGGIEAAAAAINRGTELAAEQAAYSRRRY